MNNLNTQKTINRVDFKIEASGYGVVNWNGPTTYYLPEKNECANNLILPKLDNFTTTTERVNKNGEKYQSYKTLDEIEFELSKHDLYISENCIKRNLFKDELITSTELTSKNSEKVLQSVYGLIRGYVVTKGKGSTSYVRAGVLHLEPFTDTLRNGNIQSYSQSGTVEDEKTGLREKPKTSFYHKARYGKTKYISYAGIDIEGLQFISLSNIFDRCAYEIKNEEEGINLANNVCEFINSLSSDKVATVTYSENYVRIGSRYETKQKGLLLDNNAISILVEETLRRFRKLFIITSSGSMSVNKVTVDYNDSDELYRIKNNEDEINSENGDMKYTQYYSEVK